MLEKANKDWIQYIQKLKEPQLEQEIKIYDEYSENSTSFINELQIGRETIDSLEMFKRNLELEQQTIILMMQTIAPHQPTDRLATQNRWETNMTASQGFIKLPKFQLQMFQREVLKWNEFWEGYNAAVDSQAIPDIQKLIYLLNYLKREAHGVVDICAIKESN